MILIYIREILIGQLEAYIKQMNEELTNYMKSSKSTPKGKNMPSTMRTIIWITQSENTVRKKLKLLNIIDPLRVETSLQHL